MKNKKKLLLLGVGAMSALALSVGATSTFAWFNAVAEVEAHVTTAAMTASVNGSSATIDSIGLYAKFTITSSDAPKLTTSDGYCYALDNNNKIRKAEDGDLNTRYGTATVAFEGWYSDAAGTESASAADIKQIVSGELTLDVHGGARTRMAKTAPANAIIGVASDNSFDEVFTDLGESVQLTVTITESAQHTAAPTFTIEQSGAVYFSIAGEVPDQTKAQMQEKLGDAADPDVLEGEGELTQTLEVEEH